MVNNKDSSSKDAIRLQVLQGVSIRQLCKTDKGKLAYIDDKTKLDTARSTYLAGVPLSSWRMNFYIHKTGDAEEQRMLRELPRLLAPVLGLSPDMDIEELAYTVSYEISFKWYDGQPIIVWHDIRSEDFVKEFGKSTSDVFASKPKKIALRKKHGNVNLVNAINIINTTEPYDVFLNGLISGAANSNTETDELEHNQLPIIIPIAGNAFAAYFRKTVFDL